MKTFLKGRKVKSVRKNGNDALMVLRKGLPSYIKSIAGLGMDELIPTTYRIVEDGGQKWFEFGFDVGDETPIVGNPVYGWEMVGGYGYLYLEWRRNETQWQAGKFVAAPVPTEVPVAGVTRYWSRAVNPVSAPTATAASLVAQSTAETGDSRANPITGMKVGGVAVTLPNAPYSMPADAAQMQTDLRAEGYTGATVDAISNVEWRIELKDVTFGASQTAQVEWAKFFLRYDEDSDTSYYSGRKLFKGSLIDSLSREIAPEAFARVVPLPGSRYGHNTLITRTHPPVAAPLVASVTDENADPGHPPAATIPYISGNVPRLIGNHAPASTLTRPIAPWINPPGGGTMTIAGTWWKNGSATSEHGETYSDTAEGDLIQYREIATNDLGASVTADGMWPAHTVSQLLADYKDENLAQFAALIDGKPGGSENMDLFSARDDVAKEYLRNPNLWLQPHVSQITGHPVLVEWADVSDHLGGMLITPRHILYCAHGHPRATGTWELNPATPPCKLTFALPDGTGVEAIQICQSEQSTSSMSAPHKYFIENLPSFISFGSGYVDLCIAVLDRDVEDLGVHVMPVAALTAPERTAIINTGVTGEVGNAAVVFGISQGNVLPGYGRTPVGDYPFSNKKMAYIKRGTNLVATPPFSPYSYGVYGGDSGSPMMIMHRGTIYLVGVLTATEYGGVGISGLIPEINQLIAAADAGAVAMGRMAEPTGLTVSAVRPT